MSAIRWVIVDSVHHATEVVPPTWSFGNLDDKLQGFLLLVESHYRYYQFYANMFVAAAFAAIACLAGNGGAARAFSWPGAGFLALEIVLFAGSRDTLRKYYARTRQLLNTHGLPERTHLMTNGIGHHLQGTDSKSSDKKVAPVRKTDKPPQGKPPKSGS